MPNSIHVIFPVTDYTRIVTQVSVCGGTITPWIKLVHTHASVSRSEPRGEHSHIEQTHRLMISTPLTVPLLLHKDIYVLVFPNYWSDTVMREQASARVFS